MTFYGVFQFKLSFATLPFNALAMEPMGKNAGMASSVIGSLATAIAILCGTVIGQFFDMTLWPLVMGFTVATAITLIIHLYLVAHEKRTKTAQVTQKV